MGVHAPSTMMLPPLHRLSLHAPVGPVDPVAAPVDFERMEQNLNRMAEAERLAGERGREPDARPPRLAFEGGGYRPPKREYDPHEQETFEEQEKRRKPEPTCPNPTCPGPSPARPFVVYDDGSSECHECGAATPAPPSTENEAPNHEDGPDRRRAQEYGDDEKLDLYHINDEEMPGTTEHQRWWANNRMNQAMVLADCMGYDREDPDGFSISEDAVMQVKMVLRRVCPLAATDAPDATVSDNDQTSLMASPTLWAILIGLEVIARQPGGFRMPTEALRQIATLAGLNAYLERFQGRKAPRYEEAKRFLTTAKGQDAAEAQRRLNKIKVRRVAWHSIGPDNPLRRAKIDKLNALIKRSNVWGPNVGLSTAVMTGQPPALAADPLQQQQRAADARRPRPVGRHNLPHVDRIKEGEMGWISQPNPSVGGSEGYGGPSAPTTEPPAGSP